MTDQVARRYHGRRNTHSKSSAGKLKASPPRQELMAQENLSRNPCPIFIAAFLLRFVT